MIWGENEAEQICDAYREAQDVANLANAILLAVDNLLGLGGHEVLKHLGEGRALKFLAVEAACRADVHEEKMKALYNLANGCGERPPAVVAQEPGRHQSVSRPPLSSTHGAGTS